MRVTRKIYHISVGAFAMLLLGVLLFSGTNVKATPGALNGKIVYQQGISDGNIFTIYPDGTKNTQLTNTSNNQGPAFSPDGTKIAFYSTRDGDSEIYVMNHDGTNVTQLTDNATADQQPQWNSDGTKIVYANGSDGDYEIHIMNADGTGDTKVTDNNFADIDPHFSPDDSEIVYRSVPALYHDIYKMNADGTNITQLTDDTLLEAGPIFSPDGLYIYWHKFFSGNPEIMRMNTDGSNVTNITNTASDEEFDMTFSPDGTLFAFGGDLLGVSGYAVFTSNTDGSNPQLVIDPAIGNVSGFSWQPLTIALSANEPNPTITANEAGVASVDIGAMYTDAYDGIDVSSVEVTELPTSGSISITNGVVTYTQDGFTSGGFLNRFMAFIFPVAHAQGAQDTFDYRVCSESNSQLCANGSVTVNLASAVSSAELADTGASSSVYLFAGFVMLSLASLLYSAQRPRRL